MIVLPVHQVQEESGAGKIYRVLFRFSKFRTIAGGGGGGYSGAGGAGGGGAGNTGTGSGNAGTANTGGGGGGGADGPNPVAAGGAGGSGIVVVKELNKASGVWSMQSQFSSQSQGTWPDGGSGGGGSIRETQVGGTGNTAGPTSTRRK
jgi:hypothetical protein